MKATESEKTLVRREIMADHGERRRYLLICIPIIKKSWTTTTTTMKGCLKPSSRAPSPAAEHGAVKHVAFGREGSEEIFVADEWDRTPTEPARHLSYQDLVELDEIQRSLPSAYPPAHPTSLYLSTVPVGLLPLLPHPDPVLPPLPVPASTPVPRPPSHNNPRFTFLPLLPRSPSPSPPPTPSLTITSLNSSPRSTPSSSSPEPSFLQLPPSCAHGRFCTLNKRPGLGASRSPFSTTPSTPPSSKNIMVINGIEIDLDHDSLDRPTTPTQTPSSAAGTLPTPTQLWVPS